MRRSRCSPDPVGVGRRGTRRRSRAGRRATRSRVCTHVRRRSWPEPRGVEGHHRVAVLRGGSVGDEVRGDRGHRQGSHRRQRRPPFDQPLRQLGTRTPHTRCGPGRPTHGRPRTSGSARRRCRPLRRRVRSGDRLVTDQRAIANSGWAVLSPSATRLWSSNRTRPSALDQDRAEGFVTGVQGLAGEFDTTAEPSGVLVAERHAVSLYAAAGRPGLAPAGQRVAGQPDEHRAQVPDLGERRVDDEDGERPRSRRSPAGTATARGARCGR